jgi:hypothetical protein
MEDFVERRLHERIAAGVPVFYEPVELTRPQREYLTGVAAGASLGGMFVATAEPPRPGTVLVLRLYLDDADDGPPLRAKAIVRWRRRFQQPRGMGIEFLEFERLGGRRFEEWIARSTAPDGRYTDTAARAAAGAAAPPA